MCQIAVASLGVYFLPPFIFADDSDMFFSMSGSMMSMSAPGHFSDDMESSMGSTISTCSTDTSRTGTVRAQYP